ncbi:MAG: hypothetical protein ACRDSS_06915, partial [Actinocrinis sp.]
MPVADASPEPAGHCADSWLVSATPALGLADGLAGGAAVTVAVPVVEVVAVFVAFAVGEVLPVPDGVPDACALADGEDEMLGRAPAPADASGTVVSA